MWWFIVTSWGSGSDELGLQPHLSHNAPPKVPISHIMILQFEQHVPGVRNTSANTISHDNRPYFLSQVPGTLSKEYVIPNPLLYLLYIQQPG